jgi:peptide/nickel transport system ATP-binding protein
MMKLLDVNNLQVEIRKQGKEVRILDSISFSIYKGETLGIVGESGCGKSMTALSVMRLLPENAKIKGEVKLDNIMVSSLSKKQLEEVRGNYISMIFQEPLTSLNPLHRIGKQIEESLVLHTKQSKKERRQKAIELLIAVGLPRAEEIIDEYPHQLSGGMRQRVMIAMAMACQPKLLICDEPTTALDVTVQAQILELMNDLKTKNNMSMILITHDFGVVAEVCDRVLVMYAGKIVEEAPVEELFERPCHPYTQGLLELIPRLEIKKERLGSIPGSVPMPGSMPIGCRFADRCTKVMDRCRQEAPKKYEIDKGHFCSCWLYGGEEAKVDGAS